MKKNYPMVPKVIRNALVRHVEQHGAPALAVKLGISSSALYKIAADPECRVRTSTIQALSALLADNKPEVTQQRAFKFTVSLTVREAERLVAHCDLTNTNPTSFIAALVKAKLDETWGPEEIRELTNAQ